MPNKLPPELACLRRGFSSAAASHKNRICVSTDDIFYSNKQSGNSVLCISFDASNGGFEVYRTQLHLIFYIQK